MLERIRGLLDVGAMTKLLHETIAQEREIHDDLEALLSQRQDLDRKLTGLHKAAEVLELVRSDSDQMSYSIRSTCALAEHVSGKVRELDVAQSRVHDAIARIDAIVDRTSCIEGAKSALDTEDYEAAAKYVETFLELDSTYHDAVVAEGSAETAREQVQQLMLSKKQLEDVIRRRFAAASESGDHEQAVRFARLYSPLGLQEEGLRMYTTYLRKLIANRAREEYEALIESLDAPPSRGLPQADFVASLTGLFKDIAISVEENEELLRLQFGDDAVPYVIKELQEECENRGSLLLRRYIEQRKLPRLTKDAASAHKGGATLPPEALDPREVEVYLEEILLLSQRSEEYLQFMLGKLRDAEAAGAAVTPRAVELFKAGGFNRTLQELIGYYMALEEYFMVENVHKALRIDEAVPDSLATSMVDDAFYILQNCGRRGTSTGSLQSIGYVLNCINNLLGNEYKEALVKRLREPNLTAKILTGVPGSSSKLGSDFVLGLNNADVSAEYVQKLRHELDEYCSEVFPAPAERERLKAILNELADTGTSFKQLCNTGLEQLANSIVPRIRPLLDAVAGVSYELTEVQYAENELNDPWVRKLLLAVETNVTWLQPLLTTNNYDSLVHLVIDAIVRRVEAIMMQKRFNQLGGLQLDRDGRTLVGHFSAMSQRTVRDKFARLTQVATILNLEKVSEILDYWGENSGPMTWRLTPAEVRRVLGLRVDFKQEAIAALRL